MHSRTQLFDYLFETECSFEGTDLGEALSHCSNDTYPLKASVSFSAFKSNENMFPRTGSVVKRGPGGMFLNSYTTIK